MDIKDLQEERERMIQDFITAMNKWLEEFNDYVDKVMEQNDQAKEWRDR